MKAYTSPPLWLGLGFLTGWVHVQPGVVVSVVWGAALYAMVVWILRDVETAKLPEEPE